MESPGTPSQDASRTAPARRRAGLVLSASLLAGLLLVLPHLAIDPAQAWQAVAVKVPMALAAGFALLWWVALREARQAAAGRALLQQSIELLPCHFAAFDRNRMLVAWNDSYARLHHKAFATLKPPLSYAALMRVTIAETYPPDQVEAELARRIATHEAADGSSFERRYPDGQWMHIVKQRLPSGHVAGFALDITAGKVAQDRVAHLALHDPLTGLANRAGFAVALERAAADPDGASLLLVDLDHFKQVNDRHGHAAGDAVLVEVAGRLRAAMRPQDTVCRLGGDEFAVIALGVVDAEARQLGDRLRHALCAPVSFGSEMLPIGASIGLATAPADAIAPEPLQRAADMALYEAKRGGRGRVRAYRPRMGEAAAREARLREDIALALAHDEFALVWQAQRSLGTDAKHGGVLLGAEAMLRWRSPRLNRLVPPDEMLPVAAKAGLLPAIDAWVIENALAQAALWRGKPGAPPRIAINLSAAVLTDDTLPQRLATRLAEAGVPPAMLEIELPGDISSGSQDPAPLLHRIAALGIGLALDDAGAGRGAILQAARLPVRRLKLDPVLAEMLQPGHEGQRQGMAVLRALMALARSLELTVIATGIETDHQAATMRQEGVAAVQGFLTGRPMLAEDFLADEAVAAGR
jgi:diguanylate cyclase (GGDEF)-like protein